MKVIKSGEEQITLYYGKQKLNGNDYNHTGIDIVRKSNRLDTIVAAAKGRVRKIVSNVKGKDITKGYGNYIELEHADGIITRYCHIKYNTIRVKSGQIVIKGQEIGYMGDSGYTFGAHLHFEMKRKNKTIDPLPYLNDKIKLFGYGEKNIKNYTKGDYKVLATVLTVRKSPGTQYDYIRYKDLTSNAKSQMDKLTKTKVNGYIKDMIFTAIEIKNMDGESWAKTPSGWVCIYNKDGIYCKNN